MTYRLAIVTTHPIQYYAPWFRQMANHPELELFVFYLWDFGVTGRVDRAFGREVVWDIPLLDGYQHTFLKNVSRDQGTHHFWGINNPNVSDEIFRMKPDAVLCIGYNYATFLRLLLSPRCYAIPILLRGDSHRLICRRGIRGSIKRRLLTLLFRRYSAFLYVGQANLQYYKHHGVSEDKLFFAPHAVDNDRFMTSRDESHIRATQWREELGIPSRHRVVLFAGKLEDKKRPQDLIAAFLSADLPDLSLLLVGSGVLEHQLRQLAGSSANIYFAPFQNQADMPRTYAAADIVVLPSRGEGETWGLCINEAMCLGKGVIASDNVGCAADLVRSGINGLIFPAGDVEALTSCLRQAFAEPSQISEWCQNSHEIIQNYNYSRATDGLFSALDAKVNAGRPSKHHIQIVSGKVPE